MNTSKKKKTEFILSFVAIIAILATISHVSGIRTAHIEREASQSDASLSFHTVQEENICANATDAEEHGDILQIPSKTKYTEEQALKILGVCDKDSAHLFLPEIHSFHSYVYSYSKCFPDINPIQLKAAIAMGVKPVATREEVHEYVRQYKLADITNSPYYVIDPLTHSMPYLVPKCQDLLNTICINFIDSLKSKDLPPHLPIVTSVLRTSKDIKNLQKGNVNSTTNSCHCYGTTVDITYNRFYPITGDHKTSRKNVSRYNAQMKKILAEVLLDLRMQGRCYVKYEIKQACFHLTIRP